MAALAERLNRGEVLILDGAMGTELQRRGVPMHHLAWSAAALQTHPDTIRQVHTDYLRAGADVITTNTFATARHVLEPAGMGHLVRDLNTRAVELAQAARDQVAGNRQVFIAGSISAFRAGFDWHHMPAAAQAESAYQEQATLLAQAGVDLIALEMMRDIEQTTYAVRAAVATDLPTWVGFSCRRDRVTSEIMLLDSPPGETFAEALTTILLLGGSAVMVMHTEVADIAPALREVQAHWAGPVGAYAHSGSFVMPNWQFEEVAVPEAYAAVAEEWVQLGAQIVGGCCGTGPQHIRVLREQLPTRIPSPTER